MCATVSIPRNFDQITYRGCCFDATRPLMADVPMPDASTLTVRGAVSLCEQDPLAVDAPLRLQIAATETTASPNGFRTSVMLSDGQYKIAALLSAEVSAAHADLREGVIVRILGFHLTTGFISLLRSVLCSFAYDRTGLLESRSFSSPECKS